MWVTVNRLYIYIYIIYIVESNDKPYPNFLERFKFKSNLIVVKPKYEPEPYD